MPLSTTDLCDAHPDAVHVVAPLFRDYGAVVAFAGPVATVKAHEDNVLVRAALDEPGSGRVLVVDGGGSMRCAMLGGNLASQAATNGRAGIVVYGGVRDTKELAAAVVGGEGARDAPDEER